VCQMWSDLVVYILIAMLHHACDPSVLFSIVFIMYFYRAIHFSAKRGIAIACRLSVCPSVRLSVCNVGGL